MNSAELYDNVLAALHEDEGYFAAAARNWIEGTEDAPFEDPEALELYGKAKFYCKIWRSNVINSRKAKRQMVECVHKIAEKGLHNPYKEIEAGFRMLGVKPEEVKLEDEPEAIKGTTISIDADIEEAEKVINKLTEETKEVEHVLGVVEEKPGLFKRKKR